MDDRTYDIRCDNSADGAKLGLIALMTGMSEEYYCASWLSGLEFMLWNVKAGDSFGMGKITERQAALLRLLTEESGGWWCWDGASPRFVALEEWQPMAEAMKAR